MTRDVLSGARFPLPENWEVEGTICVTFVIPDDPEYLAAITGLVDDLKWSRNFDRDSTGTGAATVSRTWQKALESEPVLTRGCDVPEFRLTEACLLEVNCGTDEDPNWQPVFTSEHPGGEPETPYPPDTPEYEDDTARCIAAANIVAQLKYGTETLANDAAIVGGIAVAIIDLLGAFLFFVPGGILVDIAIAIINIAVGHTAEEFSADLPDIDWVAVRDALACMLNRDGSMSEGQREEFLTYMDGVYAGNLAWALAKIIIQNVDADGLTTDARMPQNDIDVEGCSCGWVADIDLTEASGLWEFYESCSIAWGEFSSGVGLLSTDGLYGGGCDIAKNRLVARLVTAEDFQTTQYTVYIVPGTPPDGYEQYLIYHIGTDLNNYLVSSNPYGSTSPIDDTFTTASVRGVQLLVDHTDGVAGVYGGYSRIKIYGVGAVPLELQPYIV